jgi:hypothetical protein
MKVRKGFVSNSSSSSFCIFGAALNKEMLKTFAETIHDEDIEKYVSRHKYTAKESFDVSDDDFDMTTITDYIIDKYCAGKNCNYEIDYECDSIYIGRRPDSIGDDETGKQYRESMDFMLKLFPDADMGLHEGEISC